MFSKKIAVKIFSLVVGLVFLMVVTDFLLSYYNNKRLVGEIYKSELNVVAEVQNHNVNRYFKSINDELRAIEFDEMIRSVFASAVDFKKDTVLKQLNSLNNIYDFNNIYLVSAEGKLLLKAKPDTVFTPSVIDHFDIRKHSFYYGNAVFSDNNFFSYSSVPVLDSRTQLCVGLIIAEINIKNILKTTVDHTGLGSTGEILIGKRVGNKVHYLYSSKLSQPSKLGKVIDDTYPLFQASIGTSDFGYFTDHDKTECIGYWQPISTLGLGMLVKMNTAETFSTLSGKYYQLALKSLLLIVVALIAAYVLSRLFTEPLQRLNTAIRQISTGDFPEAIPVKTNDEIGQMTTLLNTHIQTLKRTADFAHAIEKGNYSKTEYQPVSDVDILGKALVGMKDSLELIGKKDEEQNWIIKGVAELGEILRNHQDVKSLLDETTAYIYTKCSAREVSLYMVDKEVNDVTLYDTNYNLESCFAFGKHKHINNHFTIGNDFLGQKLAEGGTVYLTEIPKDFEYIKSGIKNEQSPASVLIVPTITNEKKYGIIEVVSNEVIDAKTIQFVEEISSMIAQTVFNLRINQRTRSLLEEIQNSQKKLSSLLENASELIQILDESSEITYLSPSSVNIIGYDSGELINKSNLELIHPDDVATYKSMFDLLKVDPKQPVTIQYQYLKKDGEWVWLEATGRNMINDRAIKGIVINSRDITLRRLAEEEQRKRGQMQALSENSLDLITRVGQNDSIFYVNPMIEKLTGLSVETVLNNSFRQLDINQGIIESWTEVISKVRENGKKASKEIIFPALDGEKVMYVNAIPEFDDKNAVESVLLVSHDITEQKAIEEEIRSKNQKIHASINYAERIQVTILPDNKMMHSCFEDSFMLFLPRDVVSGDFPWFYKRGDNVYLSAVDCTGHGVPGALISLVGYFLLNQVVIARGLEGAGEILNELDLQVIDTFKQNNENATIKDGMDVAFCRIDTKNMQVEYAGAHRPLYIYRNDGTFEEIKGDKFPIGGGDAYKNKTEFTTTLIDMQKGDSIFFFSDGLTDQFGGPKNRKLGGRRVQEILASNIHLPMEQIHKELSTELEMWQGDEKQTDDILVFGIRF